MMDNDREALERKLAANARLIGRLTAQLEEAHAAAEAAQSDGGKGAVSLEDVRRTQVELLQSQKLTAIGQLAAGVAHEINTPVQYVTDNTVFLDRAFRAMLLVLDAWRPVVEAEDPATITPEARARALETTRKARLDYLIRQVPRAVEQSTEGLQQVARIVRALKDFSHPSLEAPEPVDLRAVVETRVTVARNEWKYVADVEVDVEVDGLVIVRDRIAQVLLNLLVNAAHAIGDVVGPTGENGKGLIRVWARRQGEECEIRVSDTGAGIPADIRARVFEPFFTTKPVGKGTGQGLALAHTVIVEQHAGQLAFESEVGKGTTFIVRLPMGDADAHAAEVA